MQKAMGSYKAGGSGEVRRINVVYFLSRAGRTDHPHLLRVNHLHRSGVRLRDVKRWLSEVRGKDMPENFSWAYKRKYKAGYVWQDLMDDDLITPISDNEYVLKGCDVRGSPPPPCAHKPKPSSLADEKKLHGEEDKGRKVSRGDRKQVGEELQVTPDSDESSPKTPPPIDQDSPSSEGEAARFRIVLPLDLQERKRRQQEAARSAVIEQQAVVARVAASPGGRKQQPAVGGSGRMRVARVLHSMLTCGTADAVDAALQPVVLARRSGGSSDDDAGDGYGWRDTTPVCPGMDGCGIHMNRKVRVRRGGKEKAKRPEGGRQDGAVPAAHRPASLPLCSQCGNEFKPQELHSHMQLCRGLRARMRSSSNGGRVNGDKNHRRSGRVEVSSPERSSTGLLLTQS